jgi:hypothetical protein
VAEHLGAVDKNPLATGTLARGEVVSITPTGMSWGGDKYGSANSTTVCKVTVKVVGLAGHEPYEATALVPIADVYIPEFQHDVPTGTASAAPPAGPPALTGETVATKDGAQIILQSDDGTETPLTTRLGKLTAAEVLAQGLPCTVDVLSVIPLDQTNAKGEILTGLILSVRRPGKPNVQAQIGTHIPPQFQLQVTPGASLPGKYTAGLDTGDDSVVPDWDSIKA